LSNLSAPVGAYAGNSAGDAYLRKIVAEFIEKRDGPAVHSNIDNIFLTNGASEGVNTILGMLINSKDDGIMVPIPQYPLYSAAITLKGGTLVEYYLDEENNWGCDIKELE